MQRSRERRRRGSALVSLEIPLRLIADRLIALGWLLAPDRGDKAALTGALSGLIVRAIQTRVIPSVGPKAKVTFSCDIHPGTVDTLIEFGWLTIDQQDDLEAIALAFRRFAGRALEVARNGGPTRWFYP